MSLIVKLYKNTSPAIKIGKSLSEEREVAGVLLQDVEDVAAPMVELSSAVIQPATGKCDWWSCNYAYIPALGRYYFITSKTIVDNDHYVLRLRTDVLYTWRSAITGTSAWISRSKSAGSWYLPDGLVPMSSRVSISTGNPNFHPFFNPLKKGDNVTNCFILCTAGGSSHNPTPPSSDDDYLLYNTYVTRRYYALNRTEVMGVMDAFTDGSWPNFLAGDPKSGVFSLHALPLDVDVVPNGSVTIYAGDTGLGVVASSINKVYKTSASTTFQLPTPSDFRCSTGDYKIKLYLPMVGWTELDPVIAHERPYLQLSYKTNVLTGAGSCTVYLMAANSTPVDTDAVAIYHYNAAITVPLTMDTSNEKNRAVMASAITSVMSVFGAMMTQNPAIIGGAAGSAAINLGRSLLEPVKYSQSANLSGDSYDVDPYYAAIYYVKRDSPVLDNASAKTNFATCHGLRCDEQKTISSLTGFFKCANYWMDPPAGITEPELNEITSILESGAIV